MTIGVIEATRNEMLDRFTVAMDAGAGAALLNIYDGVRPATGGTATNLLAQLTMSDPSALAASGGTLNLQAITDDSAADATGTATWFRVTDSTGAFVFDGSVGATASGEDLELNTVSIQTGATVSVTSFSIGTANLA